MIVLDAGVLIARNAEGDVHHAAVERFLAEHAEELLLANASAIAESLIHAVREPERMEQFLEEYEMLGILPLDLPGGSGAAMARARAETGLKLPDAFVLYSCEANGAELATTDARLAAAARARGVTAHLIGA